MVTTIQMTDQFPVKNEIIIGYNEGAIDPWEVWVQNLAQEINDDPIENKLLIKTCYTFNFARGYAEALQYNHDEPSIITYTSEALAHKNEDYEQSSQEIIKRLQDKTYDSSWLKGKLQAGYTILFLVENAFDCKAKEEEILQIINNYLNNLIDNN